MTLCYVYTVVGIAGTDPFVRFVSDVSAHSAALHFETHNFEGKLRSSENTEQPIKIIGVFEGALENLIDGGNAV